VPARVIGSGFDGGVAAGGSGSLCGSGASGSEVEVSVATLAVAGWGRALWAQENCPVASRREAVRQRVGPNLG